MYAPLAITNLKLCKLFRQWKYLTVGQVDYGDVMKS